MEAFRFARPEALYLLLLIPLVVGLLLLAHRNRQKALDRFGERQLVNHLIPDFSLARTRFKAWMFSIALALQIFVVAGPQFGAKLETVQRKGIEIMVALDVSNSMNAQDISPSRLEMAKMALARLVDNLSDDRIGLVVFAGKSYVQLPITSDYPAAKMFLQTVETGMVQTQGTAIGSAIDMCRRSISTQEDINRAIIVITDGENHEDDAVQAAQAAAQAGIKVYTVGMGTAKGAPVPTKAGQLNNFIKDKDGNVVISKIDEASLAQIARAGDGAYIPGNNIRSGINQLVQEISSIDKAEFEAKIYKDYEDRFVLLESLVLLLLLLEMFVLARKNPRLAAFDIFTRKKADKDLFIQPTD